MTKELNATVEHIGGPERAPAELLDVEAMAALLNCSSRHIYRLSDAGKMPRPLKLGSLCRWRRQEILDWIHNGCPTCRTGGARCSY